MPAPTDLNDMFTPASPCRCGYNGTGRHQCHSGRDPLYPGGRCPEDAVPRLLATKGMLAGMQIKTSVVVACYCASCYEEFRAIR